MALTSRRDIDRGYAWVVLGAAFSIQFIAGILVYSAGVVNLVVMEQIEDDVAKTSWIGSTLFGIFLILGPVAGIIQGRFGPRVTAMAGGILSLAGMTAASFCKTVASLIITNGLITGFGICLGGNVVGAMTGQYFEKRRSAAYGLCTSGGAMGLFVAGPLSRYLLTTYGLGGTLLLLGAISFHICAAGAAMRPIQIVTKTTSYEKELDTKSQFVENDQNNEKMSEREDSLEEFVLLNRSDTEKGQHCYGQDSEQKDCAVTLMDMCANDANNASSFQTCLCCENENSVDVRTVEKGQNKGEHFCRQCCLPENRVPNLAAFIVYNVCVFMQGLADSACVFHLPNYSRLQGCTPRQTASLFTTMGAAGVVSRVAGGMISSDTSISPILMVVGLAGITGTVAMTFPLYSYTYPLMALFSVLHGTYSQAQYPLFGTITIELIGLKNVAVGYGVAYCCSGLGYLLGPPLAGVIFNLSGMYDYTYVVAGACAIMGSLCAASTSALRHSNH